VITGATVSSKGQNTRNRMIRGVIAKGFPVDAADVLCPTPQSLARFTQTGLLWRSADINWETRRYKQDKLYVRLLEFLTFDKTVRDRIRKKVKKQLSDILSTRITQQITYIGR
jgi:hypothetical protein